MDKRPQEHGEHRCLPSSRRLQRLCLGKMGELVGKGFGCWAKPKLSTPVTWPHCLWEVISARPRAKRCTLWLAKEEWEPLCRRCHRTCQGRWQSMREGRRAALAPQWQGSPLMAGTAKGTGLWRWLWGVGWSQRGRGWEFPVQGGTLQS